MNEFESMENIKVTRQEVIDAYKPFAAQGFRHPDKVALLDTPEAQAAGKLLLDWYKDARLFEGKNEGPELELGRITLFLDAGFTDVTFLESVFKDLQDLELKTIDRTKLGGRVREVKERVSNLLNNPQ